MRRGLRNGLIVGLLHVLIVSTLGAKLLLDRSIRPRVWAPTVPVDPNLPIRGRYVRLQIAVEPAGGLAVPASGGEVPVLLGVQGDRLVATPSSGSRLFVGAVPRPGAEIFVLRQPLAYFIPEHVADPSRRSEGEELWVEVTVPRRGAPRPIRLGVMKNGVLTPLHID